MAERIEGRARELIEAPNFAHAATVRRDGTPHVTTVWIDVEDGHVLLNSTEGRDWPANLRRDGRITLAVPDTDNPYEYVEIQGRLVGDTHEGAPEHGDRLAMKYLGQERYPFARSGEVRILFRIAAERIRHHGRRAR